MYLVNKYLGSRYFGRLRKLEKFETQAKILLIYLVYIYNKYIHLAFINFFYKKANYLLKYIKSSVFYYIIKKIF